MADPTKNMICANSTTADFIIDRRFSTLPTSPLWSGPTCISKNPFHPSICVVNRKGFMDAKSGRSMEVRMVQTMTILMVATMGPIAFSANMESKKDKAATVVIAIAANPKAAK